MTSPLTPRQEANRKEMYENHQGYLKIADDFYKFLDPEPGSKEAEEDFQRLKKYVEIEVTMSDETRAEIEKIIASRNLTPKQAAMYRHDMKDVYWLAMQDFKLTKQS